jgi:hypothetical protein
MLLSVADPSDIVNKLLYSEPLEGYRKRTNELILYSSYALGSDIYETPDTLVYLKPGNFDITRTAEIAMELETINRKFRDRGERFILIGPGRWEPPIVFWGFLWPGVRLLSLGDR